MNQNACRTDVERFCSRLPQWFGPQSASAQTVVVTRAPAVVDVMGGCGEECGGLVLAGALDVAVAAAVALRADGQVVICWMGERDRPVEYSFSAPAVLSGNGALDLAPLNAAPALHAQGARVILLLIKQLAAAGAADALRSGATVILQSDWPADAQIDLVGVIAAAAAEALSAACALTMEVVHKAEACRAACEAAGCLAPSQRVPLAALLGEPGSLLLLRATSQPSPSALELPEGVTIAALDAEVGRPVAAQRHHDSRVAAMMGHTIIRELIRADGRKDNIDASHLAGITPADFVERFRNRMPTKLTGKAFHDRHGKLDHDTLAVDPARIYKVRSRAEHIIYENKRVHEFASYVSKARRTGDEADLATAGDLMYASHWSHSQRCGVGTLETDLIIAALRERGPARGFFGAKSTGYGTGGGVVVLMRDTPECHDALALLLNDLSKRTERRIRVFRGAASGAARFGARPLAQAASVAG